MTVYLACMCWEIKNVAFKLMLFFARLLNTLFDMDNHRCHYRRCTGWKYTAALHNAVKWREKEQQIKVHLQSEWSSSLLSNFSPCRGSVDCEIGPIAAAESDSSALCLPFHTSPPFGQLKAITWYLHPLPSYFPSQEMPARSTIKEQYVIIVFPIFLT